MRFPSRVRRMLRIDRPDAARHAERDVEEELAFHIEARVRDLVASDGLTREAADARARAEFGDMDRARRELGRRTRRTERRLRFASALAEALGDLRYGLRGLRRNPGFAVAAVVTLGLAIAANASVFSVVDAVLRRPLPFPDPDRLALVWTGTGPEDRGRPDFLTAEAWRDRSRSFADMAFLDPATATLTDGAGAERVGVARISANFLTVLGIVPLEGRAFTAGEAASRRRVALLSHDFWQRRFDGAPDAVGRAVRIDGRSTTILGVLPPGFRIPGLNGDVYEPHTLSPGWETTGNEGRWYVLGRLRPGVEIGDARAEMNEISRALDAARAAEQRERGISVVSLERYVIGDVPRTALRLLTAAALVVLLIAAANVAALSLARGVRRASEFAVRASLGAGPGRIARQILSESLALALLSGAVGTALAAAGVGLLRTVGPADLPRLASAGLSASVLGWTLGLSLLAGGLIGLASAIPALRPGRTPPVSGMNRGGTTRVAAGGLRRGLVIAELALAVVLLSGSGLLVRSWISIGAIDPGFDPERVLSMNLSTSAYGSDVERAAFYAELLARVGALPGVEQAGMIGDFLTAGDAERTFSPEGAGAAVRLTVRVDEVSPDLFATVGASLRAGRSFSAEDGPDAPPVAIVNEALARRLFGGDDPVGRRFRNGSPDAGQPWITIVGVVADMRRQGLEVAPIPQAFVPLAQDPSSSETLLVRAATGDPLDLAPAVRDAVRSVDGRVPLYFVSSLEDALGVDLAQRRFQMTLLLVFALTALVLAGVGIYGLVHYAVAARRREFAIRMAIGARAADILGISLGEGMRAIAVGLVLGLAGALASARLGTRLLYGVSPSDPVTLLAVSALLCTVASAACMVPARRAARADPIEALRPD